MDGINYYVLFLAALIPLAVGAFYYSPLLFQNSWMSASGMTEEKIKTGNMAVIFGLSYIFSLFIAAFIAQFAIHQATLPGLFSGSEAFDVSAAEAEAFVEDFLTKYGHVHRTFTHGMVHGGFATVIIAFPIIAINSLFERRGWKYIWIHTGYWFISLMLMGGVVCAFL